MLKKTQLILLASCAIFFNFHSFAKQEQNKINENLEADKSDSKLQEIIHSYKLYAGKIPAAVIKEVTDYRIAVAEINREKRNLYKALSLAAQRYLQEEQKYKKLIANFATVNHGNVSDDTLEPVKK